MQTVHEGAPADDDLVNYRYHVLAMAVVSQAVSDILINYRAYLRHGQRTYLNEVEEAERFIRSEWFRALTDLDGDTLIQGAKEKATRDVSGHLAVPPPEDPNKARSRRKNRYCKHCRYSVSLSMEGIACYYLVYTGHRRPCDPEDCVEAGVYERKKRKKKVLNADGAEDYAYREALRGFDAEE